MKIDPIHQFNIEPIFTIGHIGNHTIAFTNSSLYMFLAVAVISLLIFTLTLSFLAECGSASEAMFGTEACAIGSNAFNTNCKKT